MDEPRSRRAERILRPARTRSDTGFPFDFFHINSINLDQDGSLLISARNTWAVYDLDAADGEIEWRLGGKHSEL